VEPAAAQPAERSAAVHRVAERPVPVLAADADKQSHLGFVETITMHVVDGLAAGFVATGPMTAFMEAAWQNLPTKYQYPLPPREITEEVGESAGFWDDMSDSARLASTMAAHFGYGAACGAVYSLAVPKAKQGFWTGAAFGLGVWTTSYLGLLPALGVLSPATRHPANRNALMIAAHVVWGGTLGAMLGRKLG
jgi:uncharacterized membrane protein YagU involved in acid resistance